MESFPSKAMRAFDKPVSFIYAPETGSFCINGTVADQYVTLTAGPAATADDHSPSILLTSPNSPAQMAELLTNPMRLKTYMRTNEMKPFSEQAVHFSASSYYDEHLPPLLSDIGLGDFIIDTVPMVHSFVAKEEYRDNLRRVHLNLGHDNTDLVSTDGHRLQIASVPVPYILRDDVPIKLGLPSKLLTALKLESCLAFDYRDVGPEGTLICFSKEYGIISIQWGKCESAFPPWQNVVPDVSLDEFGENEKYFLADHCFELLGKIPASCRKEGMSLHLLTDSGQTGKWDVHHDEEPQVIIPAFGVMTDNTGGYEVIHLAGDISEEDIPHVSTYLAIKAKYGYELGKHLKKIPTEDIAVYLGSSSSDPIRVDWSDGSNVQYTHVLMPFRSSSTHSWPSADGE